MKVWLALKLYDLADWLMRHSSDIIEIDFDNCDCGCGDE